MLFSMRESGMFSGRKVRLFTVAVARRIWDLLPDPRSRRAVEIAERFADRLASQDELENAHAQATDRCMELPAWQSDSEAAQVAKEAAYAPMADADGFGTALNAKQAKSTVKREEWNSELWYAEEEAQADLLRDLFGSLLFRDVRIDPTLLHRNDGTVMKLAKTAYEERHLPEGTLDNTRLLILADALEEAGCTDADILAHLRGSGPHVRGCWVVDLLLGKE
jgi:hypothetical protein